MSILLLKNIIESDDKLSNSTKKDDINKICDIHELNDVIEKIKMTQNKRYSLLNHKFGIKAKIDIPKNTMICEY